MRRRTLHRCACGRPKLKVVMRRGGWYFASRCKTCLTRFLQKIAKLAPHPNGFARMSAEAQARVLAALQRGVEAQLDWAKDPCSECGKYPLRADNESGLCRRCSQRVRGGHFYQNRRKEMLQSDTSVVVSLLSAQHPPRRRATTQPTRRSA